MSVPLPFILRWIRSHRLSFWWTVTCAVCMPYVNIAFVNIAQCVCGSQSIKASVRTPLRRCDRLARRFVESAVHGTTRNSISVVGHVGRHDELKEARLPATPRRSLYYNQIARLATSSPHKKGNMFACRCQHTLLLTGSVHFRTAFIYTADHWPYEMTDSHIWQSQAAR